MGDTLQRSGCARAAGGAITGISVMPQMGHLPGLSESTALCSGIGQV
jgi:hypothetical protein